MGFHCARPTFDNVALSVREFEQCARKRLLGFRCPLRDFDFGVVVGNVDALGCDPLLVRQDLGCVCVNLSVDNVSVGRMHFLNAPAQRFLVGLAGARSSHMLGLILLPFERNQVEERVEFMGQHRKVR